MKLKVIVSIVIAAALSSQAYALQITKGKLVSHKEWSTKGAKATFLAGKKTKQSMKRDGDADLMPSSIGSSTISTTAAVGTPATLSNDAYIYIENRTNESRDYYYSVNICADSEVPDTAECVHYIDTITLDPNGSFENSIAPTLTMSYNTPGVYRVYASTYYNGHNSAADSNDLYVGENGSSSSNAIITVS